MSQVNKHVHTFNAMQVLFVLFILFKVLDLGQVADWSWWLVFIPVYVSVAAVALERFSGWALEFIEQNHAGE